MRLSVPLLAAAVGACALALPALAENPAPPADPQAPSVSQTEPEGGVARQDGLARLRDRLQNAQGRDSEPGNAGSPGLVRRQKLQRSLFAGSVSAVGDDSITVEVIWTKRGTVSAGRSVTVVVGPETKFTKAPRREAATLADLEAGDLVGVGATQAEGGTLTATRIHISCNCHWVGGTVTANDGTVLTVQVTRTGPVDAVLAGQTVNIGLASGTTDVQGGGTHAITAADVQVGDRVGVVFAASGFFRQPGFDWTSATFTARRVHDWKRRSAEQPPAGELPTPQSIVPSTAD